jgi:nitroreductase
VDAIEAMETCRAIRYLKPDPVPEELLRRVLHAATRASNPGNSQGWDFVVLRDAAKKKRICETLEETMGPAIDAIDPGDDPVQRRVLAGASHLIHHLDRVPVLVFVCGRPVYPPGAPSEQMVWSALYPAAQNLIVAARSLGLGSTFTTFHLAGEAVVRETLGIPPEVRIAVTIALGYPDRAFGPVARKPLDEVLHWDHW